MRGRKNRAASCVTRHSNHESCLTHHGRRIGLLGGSFNPAHAGHLHISLLAMKRLNLDEIWWLVSPHNPLKTSRELADYTTRFAHACCVATHPRIRVMDVEQRHHLRYTIDTIAHLTAYHPTHRFVWLMGADNLAQFHRWRAWRRIARLLPIAILDRAPYGIKALHAPFALTYARHRLVGAQARTLAHAAAPAWAYLTIPRHPLSATWLRKTLGKNAFLSHNASDQPLKE